MPPERHSLIRISVNDHSGLPHYASWLLFVPISETFAKAEELLLRPSSPKVLDSVSMVASDEVESQLAVAVLARPVTTNPLKAELHVLQPVRTIGATLSSTVERRAPPQAPLDARR